MSTKRISGTCVIATAWALSACSGVGLAQEPPAPPSRLVLLSLAAAGGVHQVIDAQIVESPAPLLLDAPNVNAASLNYVVSDAAGTILAQGSIPNPYLVRSPLPFPGEAQQGHATVVLPESQYLLRLPYDEHMKYLRLSIGAIPAAARTSVPGAVPAPAPPDSVTIDLEPWLTGR